MNIQFFRYVYCRILDFMHDFSSIYTIWKPKDSQFSSNHVIGTHEKIVPFTTKFLLSIGNIILLCSQIFFKKHIKISWCKVQKKTNGKVLSRIKFNEILIVNYRPKDLTFLLHTFYHYLFFHAFIEA